MIANGLRVKKNVSAFSGESWVSYNWQWNALATPTGCFSILWRILGELIHALDAYYRTYCFSILWRILGELLAAHDVGLNSHLFQHSLANLG